jgi:hypothetical protein
VIRGDAIIVDRPSGVITLTQLADLFGVSRPTIHRAWNEYRLIVMETLIVYQPAPIGKMAADQTPDPPRRMPPRRSLTQELAMTRITVQTPKRSETLHYPTEDWQQVSRAVQALLTIEVFPYWPGDAIQIDWHTPDPLIDAALFGLALAYRFRQ